MATIRRRGNSWQAQIRILGRTPVSRSFRTKSEALIWSELQESSDTKLYTMSEVLDIYYRSEAYALKGATQTKYKIRVIMRHPICTKLVGLITAQDIASYRDDRLKTVSAGTVFIELATIRRAFNSAISGGITNSANPTKGVRNPKQPSGRTLRLEPDDAIKLYSALEQNRTWFMKPVVHLAIETAMRRGELLSLEWKNVDLKKGTAHLPDTKSGYPRTVALTPRAISILEVLNRSDKRVFPVNASCISQGWTKIRNSASISLRFHDLRHEAISRFFELGLNVPEVASQSGHRDYKMLARYTHPRHADIATKLAHSAPLRCDTEHSNSKSGF